MSDYIWLAVGAVIGAIVGSIAIELWKIKHAPKPPENPGPMMPPAPQNEREK